MGEERGRVEVGTKNYDPIFKVGVLLALWMRATGTTMPTS